MNVDPNTLTKEQMIDLVSGRLVKLCQEIATIIAISSKDEGGVLDGVRIASEGIRTMACEGYVKIQKEKGKV